MQRNNNVDQFPRNFEARIHFCMKKVSSSWVKWQIESLIKKQSWGMVFYKLGEYFKQQNDIDEAIKCFEDAVTSNLSKALYELAEIFRAQTTVDAHWRALEKYLRFFEVYPIKSDTQLLNIRTGLIDVAHKLEKENKPTEEVNKKICGAYYVLFDLDLRKPNNALNLITHLRKIKSLAHDEQALSRYSDLLKRLREYILQDNKFKLTEEFDKLWMKLDEPEARVMTLKNLAMKKDSYANRRLADYYYEKSLTETNTIQSNQYQIDAAILYRNVLSLTQDQHALNYLEKIAFCADKKLEEKQSRADQVAAVLICDYELAANDTNKFMQKLKENRKLGAIFQKAISSDKVSQYQDFVAKAKRKINYLDEYKVALRHLHGHENTPRDRALAGAIFNELGNKHNDGFCYLSAGDAYLEAYHESKNAEYAKLAMENYALALKSGFISVKEITDFLRTANEDICLYVGKILIKHYSNLDYVYPWEKDFESILSELFRNNITKSSFAELIDELASGPRRTYGTFKDKFVIDLYKDILKSNKNIPSSIKIKLYSALTKLDDTKLDDTNLKDKLYYARMIYLESEECKEYSATEKATFKDNFIELYLDNYRYPYQNTNKEDDSLFTKIVNKNDIVGALASVARGIADRVNMFEDYQHRLHTRIDYYYYPHRSEDDRCYNYLGSELSNIVARMIQTNNFKYLRKVNAMSYSIGQFHLHSIGSNLRYININSLFDLDLLTQLHELAYCFRGYNDVDPDQDAFSSKCNEQLNKSRALHDEKNKLNILLKQKNNSKEIIKYAEKANLLAMEYLAKQPGADGLKYCRKIVLLLKDSKKTKASNLLLTDDEILQIGKNAKDKLANHLKQCRIACVEAKQEADKPKLKNDFLLAYMSSYECVEKDEENRKLFLQFLSDPVDVVPHLRIAQFKVDLEIKSSPVESFCEVIKRIDQQKQYAYLDEALATLMTFKKPVDESIRRVFEKFDVSKIENKESLETLGSFAMDVNLTDLMHRCYERKLTLEANQRQESKKSASANGNVSTLARLFKLLDTSGSDATPKVDPQPRATAPSAPELSPVASPEGIQMHTFAASAIETAPSAPSRNQVMTEAQRIKPM